MKYFLCASFDPLSEWFESSRYWRGPVWINMNWMLYQGFSRYGFLELAKRIKNDSIELIEKFGFYEYFDSRQTNPNPMGSGYGGNNFSWSAALLIDFLKNDQ